jgi:pyruvate/2-oxoglutarate dehydrogenase complex dihydrolipoamide acyltransferase (E2) component
MEIQIDADLWASSMMPEGILERWLVQDGAPVLLGQAVAEVRIEDALHELLAPGAGRLRQAVFANDLIEPGSVIAHIDL